MGRTGKSMAACLAAMLIAGCGGGDAPAPATVPVPMVRAAVSIDATALMDWAEATYPMYFPGHSANATLYPYTYRAYSLVGGGTAYLGVTGDGGVYVWSPQLFDGNLTQVGTLSDFACRVRACPTLSGTAATGAPIAGALLTVQDANANTMTTTTGADGAFSVATDGLTPPFLLQLSAGGTHLYSVTADTQTATVANVTPFTDLLVRSWYGVQATTPELAFGSIAAHPAPPPLQVQLAAQDLFSMTQVAIGATGADLTQPLDFITRPFSADGTGTDRFLAATRVTNADGGANVVISIPGGTETLALSYDASGRSVTMSAATTDGTQTSTAWQTSVVGVTSAETTSVQEIDARLAEFASVVNAKGSSLTVADLQPFFASDGMQNGLTMAQWLPDVASQLGQGQTVTISIRQLLQLDPLAGTAQVMARMQQTLGDRSDAEDSLFVFRKTGGVWLATGNGRIGEISVKAEARHNQGADQEPSGPSVNIDARPVEGTVSSVVVGGVLGAVPVQVQAAQVISPDLRLTPFVANTGVLTGSLPTAGSIVTLTLNQTAGGSVTYSLPLNAFTTEQISITTPVDSSLAAANLGRPLAVSWTLPTTYAVQRVRLGGQVFTADPASGTGFQCGVENTGVLGPTSTSGTITLPATCGGQPVVRANISVAANGVNGERSFAIWFLK